MNYLKMAFRRVRRAWDMFLLQRKIECHMREVEKAGGEEAVREYLRKITWRLGYLMEECRREGLIR